MSFLKTLATLAVGFAAAKGIDRVRKAGGLTAMQDQMKSAGNPGGLADTLGAMGEKMGIPGATEKMRAVLGQIGGAAASGTAAAQTGMEGLMASLAGVTAAGSGALGGMISALTGGTAAGEMAEAQAKLMIRAMVEAAKADGKIDTEERSKILLHLADAPAEEVAFVEGLLDGPQDLAGLVAATDATLREQVYSASLMAIRLDTPTEHAYLQSLARGLGLDAATVASIHANMGIMVAS